MIRTKRMKLCRVAALTLVGWFLMMPPTIPGTGRVNRDAPLSEWTIASRWPRSQGCETAKDRAHEAGMAAQADRPRARENPDLVCPRCAAVCVEDDDPRLKSK